MRTLVLLSILLFSSNLFAAGELCRTSSDCSVGEECISRTCTVTSCTSDSQCGSNEACRYGECILDTSSLCNNNCKAWEWCVPVSRFSGECELDLGVNDDGDLYWEGPYSQRLYSSLCSGPIFDVCSDLNRTCTPYGFLQTMGETCGDCLVGYHLEGGECVSDTKTVSCTDNAPTNSTSIIADVTINWVDGAWETPADCVWGCNPYYTPENGGCISPAGPAAQLVDVQGGNPGEKEWICDTTINHDIDPDPDKVNCMPCQSGYHLDTPNDCPIGNTYIDEIAGVTYHVLGRYLINSDQNPADGIVDTCEPYEGDASLYGGINWCARNKAGLGSTGGKMTYCCTRESDGVDQYIDVSWIEEFSRWQTATERSNMCVTTEGDYCWP